MNTITHSELATKMSKIQSSFIGIKALTKQNKLNKGRGANAMTTKLGIDSESIKKEFIGTVYCGSDYEKLVNNRLKKEGKAQLVFEAGEMSGVEWIAGAEGKVLINAKGELQMRTYPDLSNNKPLVSYVLDGKALDIKESKFDEYRKPVNEDEGDNQGLDKPIKPRNYGFKSLLEVTLDGETFKVIPD